MTLRVSPATRLRSGVGIGLWIALLATAIAAFIAMARLTSAQAQTYGMVGSAPTSGSGAMAVPAPSAIENMTQGAVTTPAVGTTSGQISSNGNQRSGFSPVFIAGTPDAGRAASEPSGASSTPISMARVPARPQGEFEIFVANMIGRTLNRFGSALVTEAANGFAPPATASVPPGYTLNPGDELVIGLTGSVEASNLHVVVDSEGRIFIPRVGAIEVSGIQYGDLPALLRSRLSSDYRNFKLTVAVARLHGIRVYVTGYAERPGSYTLNSLSTLINGVLAAGGPSAGGSFRFIELRRGGRTITRLDLYDPLLKGDMTNDAVLENGDVVFIGPVGSQVAVTGSVNAEAIYEMKPGETLRSVLSFAGGFNTVADDRRLLVARLSTMETMGWEEMTVAESDTASIERGEIVRVLSAVDLTGPIERQSTLASISGEVVHPGHYYMPPGSTLGDLLARAGGLMPGAFTYGAQFLRTSVATQQKSSFDRAMADLELAAAAKPLTVTREDGGLTAADVSLQMAAVSDIIAQLKERKPDGRLVLDVQSDSTRLPPNLVLENDDALVIPARPVAVGIAGAVKQPGSLLYTDGLSLADYLARAGGPLRMADRSEIFVVRANGSVVSRSGGWFSSDPLNQPALRGDLIVVPVRNAPPQFWTVLKDATQILYQTAFGAASIKFLTQ